MKSEFLLAFNEICESRGLPKEEVFEALKTALVSAYRRDMNVSNTQAVKVEIDPRTGEPTIYAEKEVVDNIVDNRTEVLLSVARRQGYPDAQIGDLVMVDSTTANFGRIAAQTAKQVLLQRVREAEREQLYEDFSDREGELVNGTVQSVSGQHITIGLGRTEAIMPKSQQVPGERYRPHDKIRVYVLEVRRTNRGPQIFVSRNHRNLLRRLLELEVPEIYNGQVDIKSIAREAGQRSKVAVQALQPGVDPVGACVGMRGVRIQSIVRELNDEKIDVIEWDPDQRTFIAKALSPARVSHVFLEEHPTEGKTAIVIVPDDQLSLAIGREGQNARLAAKLTGWRIDIKSLTEAAQDSLNRLDDPRVDKSVAENEELIEQVKQVLAKKEAGRPITAEDYLVLDRLIMGVEGRIVASRAAEYDELRKLRAEARKAVPAKAWDLPLDELDLPGRIHNLLLDNEIDTVGAVLQHLMLGDEVFLNFRGFGEGSLETLKKMTADYLAAHPLEEEAEEETAEPVEEAVEAVEAIAEEAEPVEAVEEEEEPVVEETAVSEPVEEPEEAGELVAETVDEAEPEEDLGLDLEDLSKSLVDVAKPVKKQPKKKKKQPKIVVVSQEDEEEEELESKGRRPRKGRQLIYDEDAGEVVVRRKRKGSRKRPDWEEFDIDDLDEAF
jgi:N utilization substance protein A